ncbi:MAG: hypothetical protein GY841_16825, partial [FCB group bacterium]|nr:hypothetical protein [FCB group bacterium]
MNQPPEVTLPDSIHFFCDPGEICLPLTAFDADGNIETIAVDTPAYLSTDRQSVCMDIEQAGTYNITVSVIDACGETTTVTAVVTAIFNSAPSLYAPPNTEIFNCQPGEICVGGFDIFDIDENLVNIEFDPPGEYSTGNFCFTADTVGRYSFVVRAIDECGLVSEQEFFVNFDLGNGVSIDCPIGVQPISICGPDSVCLGISTLPQNSSLRVIEGDAVYADGSLCFYAAEAGLHEFTLVADSDCGSDTCTVTFDVSLNEIPQATAPDDQELFVCDLSPITLSGFSCFDNDDNLASCDVDNGELVDGSVTFTPVEGINVITLTAIDDCEKTSTSQTTVTVTLNSPPVATCPGDIEYVFSCEPQEICFGSGFTSTDPDNNIFSETVSHGVL